MWPGPYGEWGSRKYLLASLDQSLRRMGLDYVDIFYSHRYDPDTPLEETMGALDQLVHSGKALYVGISSYGPQKTREAAAILRELRSRCLIHQPSYSILNRWVEKELLGVLETEGVGCIAFSPLAQGLLTTKYLKGVPDNSRAARNGFFNKGMSDRSQPRERARAQCDRTAARPEPRADGDCVGAAQARRDQRVDWSQPLGSRSKTAWVPCAITQFSKSELDEIDRTRPTVA